MVEIDKNILKELQKFKINKNDLIKLDGSSLEVGFFEEAKYKDGINVAFVALCQDYGTSRIPARPFFRSAISDKSSSWTSYLGKCLKQNKNTPFALMGEKIRADIIDSIMRTNTPPLKPATIALKKSSKPLIDTGLMRRSVTYKVH